MSSLSQAASSVEKRTNARYWIVVMLFIVTSFNYGDRATCHERCNSDPHPTPEIRSRG
ncbi:MFS transporter [Escherichia coli]|nr:MFS transporter [Escherichia coli]